MEEHGLFPTIEVPELLEESNEYEDVYKPSVAWDAEKGDFVRDGANRLVKCDGREAYKTWCYKTVLTERFSHLAYPASLGVEMEDALKEESGDAVESALERTITEALMVNPRTEYVRGFSFIWDGDSLSVSFLVKGISYEEIPLHIAVFVNID